MKSLHRLDFDARRGPRTSSVIPSTRRHSRPDESRAPSESAGAPLITDVFLSNNLKDLAVQRLNFRGRRTSNSGNNPGPKPTTNGQYEVLLFDGLAVLHERWRVAGDEVVALGMDQTEVCREHRCPSNVTE